MSRQHTAWVDGLHRMAERNARRPRTRGFPTDSTLGRYCTAHFSVTVSGGHVRLEPREVLALLRHVNDADAAQDWHGHDPPAVHPNDTGRGDASGAPLVGGGAGASGAGAGDATAAGDAATARPAADVMARPSP